MSAIRCERHASASAFTSNDFSTSLPEGSTYLARQRFPLSCFALSTCVPSFPCSGFVHGTPLPSVRCHLSSTPLRCALLYVMAGDPMRDQDRWIGNLRKMPGQRTRLTAPPPCNGGHVHHRTDADSVGETDGVKENHEHTQTTDHATGQRVARPTRGHAPGVSPPGRPGPTFVL